jgi:hypothetical protein
MQSVKRGPNAEVLTPARHYTQADLKAIGEVLYLALNQFLAAPDDEKGQKFVETLYMYQMTFLEVKPN